MEDVIFNADDNGQSSFKIMDGVKQLGEMVVSLSGKNLTVYHTEVSPDAQGKGLANKMLTAMTDYARKDGLKVIPLCPYVLAQFQRHPDEYNDIWQKGSE